MTKHSLPFVSQSSNWDVPYTDDFFLACDRGEEYAAQFIQCLKESREIGALGSIVEDMDFTDRAPHAVGYREGFFSFLEHVLLEADIDVMGELRKLQAEAEKYRQEDKAKEEAIFCQ